MEKFKITHVVTIMLFAALTVWVIGMIAPVRNFIFPTPAGGWQ